MYWSLKTFNISLKNFERNVYVLFFAGFMGPKCPDIGPRLSKHWVSNSGCPYPHEKECPEKKWSLFFYFYDLQFSLSTSLFCPNMPISTHQYTKVLLVNVIIENFVAYSCLIYITKVHIWQQIKLMLGTWSGFMIIWQSLILLWEKKKQSDNFSNSIYDTWYIKFWDNSYSSDSSKFNDISNIFWGVRQGGMIRSLWTIKNMN